MNRLVYDLTLTNAWQIGLIMQSGVLTYFTLRRTINLKNSPHRFIQSEIKTKPDHESLFHVFRRFAITPWFAWFYWTVCVFCDWLECLLWFWFYDTKFKTSLYGNESFNQQQLFVLGEILCCCRDLLQVSGFWDFFVAIFINYLEIERDLLLGILKIGKTESLTNAKSLRCNNTYLWASFVTSPLPSHPDWWKTFMTSLSNLFLSLLLS